MRSQFVYLFSVMVSAPTTSGDHPLVRNTRVLVRGYDDMSLGTLGLFLENRKRCGGGPVSHITMDAETDVATVTFKDLDGTIVTRIFRNIIEHVSVNALVLSVIIS